MIFGVAEAATVGLVSLWFAGGALVALILASLGVPVLAQIIAFLVVSGALLACLRPFARRLLSAKRTRTNADRAIGQHAVVTEEICDLLGTGAVKISGVEWTARTGTDVVIPVGALVTVLAIEGAKVRVEPVSQPAVHP